MVLELAGKPGIGLELFEDGVDADQLAIDLTGGIASEKFALESRQVDLQLAYLAVESLSFSYFLKFLDLGGARLLGFLGLPDAPCELLLGRVDAEAALDVDGSAVVAVG